MTATQTGSGPLTVIERLQAAINRHDLDAMVACFAPEYVGTFPAHPDRVAHGPAGVRENWSQIFGLVPDLKADILGSAEEGGIVWTEWQWTGTRRDGATSVMCGVTVQGVQDDQLTWARLYMEPVQEGIGSAAAIREQFPEGTRA